MGIAPTFSLGPTKGVLLYRRKQLAFISSAFRANEFVGQGSRFNPKITAADES
jgi:hypothetical protein